MNKKQVTAIEQYAIDRIKEKRKQLKISQRNLAFMSEMLPSFIGEAENPKRRTKYNLNHINEIARALKCSPRDFLPEKPLRSKPKKL